MHTHTAPQIMLSSSQPREIYGFRFAEHMQSFASEDREAFRRHGNNITPLASAGTPQHQRQQGGKEREGGWGEGEPYKAKGKSNGSETGRGKRREVQSKG